MKALLPNLTKLYTNIDELSEAKKALEKIDANIAGVVVNRTQGTKRGRYSNYYE